MRGALMMLGLWVLSFLSLLLWVLGLALDWGGWVWVFFVIGLAALGTNVLALSGKRH